MDEKGDFIEVGYNDFTVDRVNRRQKKSSSLNKH